MTSKSFANRKCLSRVVVLGYKTDNLKAENYSAIHFLRKRFVFEFWFPSRIVSAHLYMTMTSWQVATGPDAIPTRFLHDFAAELAPIMTKLFQLSLDTGKIPDDWREASIVPVCKKGERQLASNYRPVSLTSVSCKLLEHIVHSQIMDHYDSRHLLSPTNNMGSGRDGRASFNY